MRPGTCRFCGCSERDPCPTGCGWTDATRTVCSGCSVIAAAEAESWRVYHPEGGGGRAFRSAYRRAFIIGWWFGPASKAPVARCPYRDVRASGNGHVITYSRAWRSYWSCGLEDGALRRNGYYVAGGVPLPRPRPFIFAGPARRRKAA